MKSKFLKFFFILLYLLSPSSTYSIEHPNIKNLILYKVPKKLENIVFKNKENKSIYLIDFKDKLVILNFWATWCAPCREEMPSLDKLVKNPNFKNLQIFPINVGRENINKSEKFYEEINIVNLDIFQDNSMELSKKLVLRGIPTTILVSKNGEEFARILGSINFNDKKFINWLKNYD